MRLTAVLQARQASFKYWQRFVDSRMQEGAIRQKWNPIVGWQEKKREHWHYDENRPWTMNALEKQQQLENLYRGDEEGLKKAKRNVVNPIKNWNMFREDRVMVMVGKDKGKIGTINTIIKERNWVFVDGLNVEYEIMENTKGPPVCQRKEKPLLATTQVQLVDPEDNKPTTVDWQYTEDGEKVRVSKRTGRIVPLPPAYHEYPDGTIPEYYVASKTKDTAVKDLEEVTYKPKLCTFEEDIMDSMGIKEDRVRKPTYWY